MCCTDVGKLYTQAAALPVGASFLNKPHLDAFEGPTGADCHVDVAVPIGVEALRGSRAFRAHTATGMKNPFLVWI